MSKFIDQARIMVQAGSGGDGHVGFHRAKYVPKGGPDGGDGGDGGDVILVGSPHMGSLQDFQHKRHFRAESGEKGGRNQCAGASGESLEIPVPLGTLAYDDADKKLIGEITREGERLVVADGGKGGLGNLHFVSSTNRAPRQFTPGEKREEKWIHLELRLLADVGIIGPPNAGKSTLLSSLTAARPKIGNYPFTTLSPSLGVLTVGEKKITVADVPGLIEGAHEGAGLGIQFLRHVARTRLLLYLLPIDAGDPDQVWHEFEVTRNELSQYDRALAKRPSIVGLNKIDLKSTEEVQEYVKYFRKKKIKLHAISAKQGSEVVRLAKAIADRL
jgi:GTPase